jgi:hypothetical protein
MTRSAHVSLSTIVQNNISPSHAHYARIAVERMPVRRLFLTGKYPQCRLVPLTKP